MQANRLWILLGKKKNGEASAAELEELKQLLLENSSSGYTNEIIEKIWDARLLSVPEQKLSPETWDRIAKKTLDNEGKVVFRLNAVRWMAAASILVIIAAASLVYYVTADKNASPERTANVNQVSTQPGSKSKLELPDGSQVWLNANSKLTYSNAAFGTKNREVILSGEAFFDVVKNDIPFIIHTRSVNITVKGTAFNVKAYPKEETVETSLVRGLVEITTDQDPERRILLKPNEKIVIPVNGIPHKTSSFRKSDTLASALYSITKLGSGSKGPAEIVWINDRLVFDNETFAEIAPKMESWYNIRIIFADSVMKDKRFSGVIEKESLKEVLNAMKLSAFFEYRISENELWVGKK